MNKLIKMMFIFLFIFMLFEIGISQPPKLKQPMYPDPGIKSIHLEEGYVLIIPDKDFERFGPEYKYIKKEPVVPDVKRASDQDKYPGNSIIDDTKKK